jgi:Ni/Co efflux regulator RcnB
VASHFRFDGVEDRLAILRLRPTISEDAMKRIVCLTTALCFALSGLAVAAPGNNNDRPMTKPAFGQKPVGEKPKPPGGGHHRPPGHHKPPGGGHKPPPGGGHKPPPGGGHKPPPGHKPPGHKPPGNGHHKPPGSGWHKPRPGQWWWRGKWINRIRVSAFMYPRGWSYRYWYVGDLLPALFLAPQYYYDDVAPLGLETPPPGYRWVRYGPDLLLVNLRTGSVEETAYGVFY